MYSGLVDACVSDVTADIGGISLSQLLITAPPIAAVESLLTYDSSELQTVKLLGWNRWASRLLDRAQMAGVQTDCTPESVARLRSLIAIRSSPQVALIKALAWLSVENIGSRDAAHDFVRASTWWISHASARPVRAPAHAEHLECSSHGWVLQFGANRLMVSKALSRCRDIVLAALDEIEAGHCPVETHVRGRFHRAVASSVENYQGAEYDGYYPDRDGRLVFGTQAIDLRDAATHVIQRANLAALLDNGAI